MKTTAAAQLVVSLALTQAISRTRTVEEIYEIALDALGDALGVTRASILLFDTDGVMRFKAYRGLSAPYRAAVEGHTPWTPESPNSKPIEVADALREPSLAPFRSVIEAEGIASLAFIPLVCDGHVIGKFMLYHGTPRTLSDEELQLAAVIASQVAFAVQRTHAEDQARRNEERLRFALDAASMGTWDWDLVTNKVRWSDNLEAIHGLPPGTFDGTFASYEREIHPDDRERVLASVQRALTEGVPHDVEYRIVAPDGTVRWVEGKGRVEYERGKPVRMTGVCVIVTRRKEAELARVTAAEEANRQKDDFLATLSHELRTPLNAISGWAQVLKAGGVPQDRVQQAIEVIDRNARLQAQLIEDILDVSRIVGGKLEIERVPVLLPPLIEEAVSGSLPAAGAKGIRLKSIVSDVVPIVDGDPKRLHQVLGNLLSNAIKFTPEHGEVEVRCAPAADSVEIAVVDTGIGIDPEFLPFVFDRFRQADGRSTRRHAGLGLGLAIARHLVEQHGGSIHAHSDGPGRGTAMTVVLPAAAYNAVQHAAGFSRGGELPDDLRLDGMSVLVVDDDEDSRELLAAVFGRCGARILQCDAAPVALDMMTRTEVHLLIADIGLPDLDGYELISRVRDRHRKMPAIAVTAYARPQDRDQAYASGYDAYCAKPIVPRRLLHIVRDVMLGRALER